MLLGIVCGLSLIQITCLLVEYPIIFHKQNSEFCKYQVRVQNYTSGCLLLNHDAPLPIKTNYNTSDDILALLSEPNLIPFFKVGGKMTFFILGRESGVYCDVF